MAYVSSVDKVTGDVVSCLFSQTLTNAQLLFLFVPLIAPVTMPLVITAAYAGLDTRVMVTFVKVSTKCQGIDARLVKLPRARYTPPCKLSLSSLHTPFEKFWLK